MKQSLAILTLLLMALTAAPAPALAQDESLLAERLTELAGKERPSEIWGRFVADFDRWADADSLLQLHLELGNTDLADGLIRKLLVRKLDAALFGETMSLQTLGALYHLVSIQERDSEAFRQRYAPVRRRISDAFYADFASHGATRFGLRRHVDWDYLTLRFAGLDQENRYRLFILLLNDGEGATNAPTRAEMRVMWKTIEADFADPENQRRFQRMFREIAGWEVNALVDTRALDWDARRESRLAWFHDELQIAFPEDSYEALKLELFARIDTQDSLSRTGSFSESDLAMTNLLNEPQNRELTRRFLTAVLKGDHPLTGELKDRGFVNLLRNLDFGAAFKGHEEELGRLSRDLLESLLASRAKFNDDLRTLSLWDQVMTAWARVAGQSLSEDPVFERAWKVYLGQSDEFDFEANPLESPQEIERFRIRHAQAMQRLVLLDPSLATPGAPVAATLPPSSPDETLADTRTDRVGVEGREAFCNLTFQQQN